MAIIINTIGILLIGFIVWWFWLVKRGREQQANQDNVKITVDGGVYAPNTIKAKAGETITLTFHRKDPSPCAESVIFADLDISLELPVNQNRDLSLKVDKPGKYEFTCPMGMYRGQLIIT